MTGNRVRRHIGARGKVITTITPEKTLADLDPVTAEYVREVHDDWQCIMGIHAPDLSTEHGRMLAQWLADNDAQGTPRIELVKRFKL